MTRSPGPGQLAHLFQELDDLVLDRHVEPGGRLVGDQQFAAAGDGHGDHHPLRHAAGELVRVGAHPPLRVGDVDGAQQVDRPPQRLPLAEPACGTQHLRDLRRPTG